MKNRHLTYKVKKSDGRVEQIKIPYRFIVHCLMRITLLHYYIVTEDVPTKTAYSNSDAALALTNFPASKIASTTTCTNINSLFEARKRAQSAPSNSHEVIFAHKERKTKSTFVPQNNGFLENSHMSYGKLYSKIEISINTLSQLKRNPIEKPIQYFFKGLLHWFKSETSEFVYRNNRIFVDSVRFVAITALAESNRNLLMLPLAKILFWLMKHCGDLSEIKKLMDIWPANMKLSEKKLRAIHICYANIISETAESESDEDIETDRVEENMWQLIKLFFEHDHIHNKLIIDLFKSSKTKTTLKDTKDRMCWALFQAFYQKILEPPSFFYSLYEGNDKLTQDNLVEECILASTFKDFCVEENEELEPRSCALQT